MRLFRLSEKTRINRLASWNRNSISISTTLLAWLRLTKLRNISGVPAVWRPNPRKNSAPFLATNFCSRTLESISTILIISAVSVLLALGCDKAKDAVAEKVAEKITEKVMEKGTGEKVDIETSDKSFSIKTKDDKGNELSLKTGTEIPEDWPKKIPVYPGAEVAGSLAMSKIHFTLTLLTTDPQSKVIEFYKSKLSDLKQEALMDMGEQKMLRLSGKLDDEQVAVTVVATHDKKKNKTAIMLGVEKQSKK